ncbi:MAG TPA: tryptophan-rich sensory protein [Anaerolineae bacterium]|nr:tryptophan-rich sensory protein [Anaerolineae bacterium]
MENKMMWRYINLVAALVTIGVNAMATLLPLNGLETGEISDRFEVYFTPAGYVFSIWGVIYVGWLAFSIYGLTAEGKKNERIDQIGPWFLISSVANSGWIFLWHYEYFILSVGVMGVLLASLLVIYVRLEIGQYIAVGAERWCLDIPFSVYLGWVTVATIANITAVLDYVNWGAWGIAPEIWLNIILAVAVAIAVGIRLTRRDGAYLAVFVWAFAGIATKHADVTAVAAGAWLATISVALLIVAYLPAVEGKLPPVFRA